MKKNNEWPVDRSLCMVCREELSGRSYTIAIERTNMTVRKAAYGTRSMHKECAERWLKENRVTPENAHTVPAVEKARAELEQLLKDLRILREKIWDRQRILKLTIYDHHKNAQAALKGETREPVDRYRSSVCTGCKKTYLGYGYLSMAVRDKFGSGRRFCFDCLEHYGELGLYQMQVNADAEDYIARYRAERAEKRIREEEEAKERHLPPVNTKPQQNQIPAQCVVIPFHSPDKNRIH